MELTAMQPDDRAVRVLVAAPGGLEQLSLAQ
jgi:hypothetical protein